MAARPALGDSYRTALAHGVESRDRAAETGNRQDWADALAAFEKAVEIKQTKEALFERANAASRLDFHDEACDSYKAALDLGLDGKAAEIARSFLGEHQRALATLQVSGPDGAEVRIRGRKRGALPIASAAVVPGKVQIEIEAAGYEPWATEVFVVTGETKHIRAAMLAIRLQPGPTASAPFPVAAQRSPRKDNRVDRDGASSSPWFVSGGVAAGVGVAGVVTTTAFISKNRQTLKENCVVLAGDDCLRTTADARSTAQTAADRLETLEAFRWVAIGAGTLGLGLMTVGLVKALQPARADINVSANRLDLRLTTEF